MPYILLGKVRTLLEWADEFLSKVSFGVGDWSGYPLDCLTTRALAVLTNQAN